MAGCSPWRAFPTLTIPGRGKQEIKIHLIAFPSSTELFPTDPGASRLHRSFYHRFVRVNFNPPVGKMKSVVFSCPAVPESCEKSGENGVFWCCLILCPKMPEQVSLSPSQPCKEKLGSKSSSLCKMCMYIKLLGIALTYLNYHKNKWCTKTFPGFFFFPP